MMFWQIATLMSVTTVSHGGKKHGPKNAQPVTQQLTCRAARSSQWMCQVTPLSTRRHVKLMRSTQAFVVPRPLNHKHVSCTSGQTVPTNASRFPAGSLLCENALGSSGSACQDSTNVFTFDDPNDFLVCKGENTCSRSPLQRSSLLLNPQQLWRSECLFGFARPRLMYQ